MGKEPQSAMANTSDKLLEKHIRVHPEHGRRLDEAAAGSPLTPNQMVVELAMKALDRTEWPRTEAEIHLLRSAMFTAQATIRDMRKAGRDDEIQDISRAISEIAPELPDESSGDSEPD